MLTDLGKVQGSDMDMQGGGHALMPEVEDL